ncbi:MAG: PDDEXK nuclease domain-containing protein [Bacteroidaceae bacterium]|nr:PDDEXK nuclease domain-containing protein [Bacteroidaceae bacterium]
MPNDNNNIQLTSDLQQAVGFIKQAIQRSQARALRSVNNEVLSLYYGVGRYVSENSRHNMWGKGAIKSISEQLQKEIPGLTGFGESNIKNMRKFYEEWCDFVNRQPLAADSPVDENKLLAEIRQPLAGDLDWNDFLRVPFSHHIEILSKCKSTDERIFYIHQCATRAWSKYALRDFISQDLYKNRGNLPSNFTEAIADTQLAIRTLKSFKESYLLGFINAEDLYESAEERNEPLLNKRISDNIRDFILRFGQDFMFIQPNYRLVYGEEEKFIDLLFFNRQLNCLVAVELKDCRFQPAHLGQLAFYLSLLDKQTRMPHENPPIGLVLCREMDRTVVELAIKDYTKPMGVATFRLGEDAPEEYNRILPDTQGLNALIQEDE